MRTYLATLHEKPDHHKKRFAFLASGSFTMMIFVVWALVNFGLPSSDIPVVAKEGGVEAATPFESIRGGLAAGIQAFTGTLGEVKEGLQQVDINTEYESMRNEAFDIYGR